MTISRICFAILALGAVSSLCTVSAAEKGTASRQIVNRVAAMVNGRPVTTGELRMRLGPYIRELMVLYPQQGPRFNAELVKAKKAVLDELIERELVLSEFETKGYVMKDDFVEEEINRRILTQYNGDRDAFLESLRKSGMTYSEYRDSVRKEVTVASMRSSRYERGIPPTPDEILEEYNRSKSDFRDVTNDRIRYEKIFIPAMTEDGFSSPEAQYKLAMDIKASLEKKEISFADAARKYSRDMHAEAGGQWPFLSRKDLAVEFANIAFSAEPGKLVGPLLDKAGFTILRVQEKRLAEAPSMSKVKEQVDDAVRRKQSEARYRQWVERLRGKAVIRKFV